MDEKKDEKRNEKGQFEKGWGGGPGRGHTKEDPVQLDGELLDMIEQVVRTGLGAKELKDQLKAAGIGIRVQGIRGSDDIEIAQTDARFFMAEWLGFLWDLVGARFKKTGEPVSGLDVIKRMSEVCVNCDRLGTTKDTDYVEV